MGFTGICWALFDCSAVCTRTLNPFHKTHEIFNKNLLEFHFLHFYFHEKNCRESQTVRQIHVSLFQDVAFSINRQTQLNNTRQAIHRLNRSPNTCVPEKILRPFLLLLTLRLLDSHTRTSPRFLNTFLCCFFFISVD